MKVMKLIVIIKVYSLYSQPQSNCGLFIYSYILHMYEYTYYICITAVDESNQINSNNKIIYPL